MNHNTIFFYRKSIYISVYKNFKNFLLRDSKPIFVNIHFIYFTIYGLYYIKCAQNMYYILIESFHLILSYLSDIMENFE